MFAQPEACGEGRPGPARSTQGAGSREAGGSGISALAAQRTGSGSNEREGGKRRPKPQPPPLGCKGRAAEQPPGPQSARGKGRDSDVTIWAQPWRLGGLQAVRPGSKRQAAPSPHQANHQEHGTRSRAKFKGLPSQPATEFPWGRGLLLHWAPCWPSAAFLSSRPGHLLPILPWEASPHTHPHLSTPAGNLDPPCS